MLTLYAYSISSVEESLTIPYGTAATEDLWQLSCLDKNLNGQFILKVGDSDISGSVLPVDTYEIFAVYQPADPDNFEVVRMTVSLTVLPKLLDFTCISTLTMDYGQVIDLEMLQISSLFSDVEGKFVSYTSEGALDPFVDFLPTGHHSLRLEYQPIEMNNFTTSSKDVTVEVRKYVASFHCAKSVDIQYGVKLSPSLAGTFWGSSSILVMPIACATRWKMFLIWDSTISLLGIVLQTIRTTLVHKTQSLSMFIS